MRALFLAVVLASLAADGQTPSDDHQSQILVVYSVRRDAQIVTVGEHNLPRILEEGLGGRLDYYAEFVDPARFSEVEYEGALAEFLRLKYTDHQFDLLIAVGDTALTFLDTHREVFTGSPPIVFFSASRAVKRPPNSTGIIAEYNLAGSVALAAALDPKLAHVFVVTGAENGDVAFEKIARSQLRPLAQRLNIAYLTGLATSDLEDRLRTLPPHSAVYYLSVNKDGTGQYFHPLQYLDRVATVAQAPIYSWVDSTIGRGVVGGDLKIQAAQIGAIGEVALRVLRGEAPDVIPVANRDFNVIQIDWRQIERWGLSEAGIPPAATVLFREPTVFQRYRPYIFTTLIVLLAQTALIAGLLAHRARRRRAEERLIDSQEQLRTSYDRIRDLGARLIEAQESERAYIARELHDDVSQQLALIEMDVKLLGDGGQEADSSLGTDVLRRVQDAGRSVRDLSHRLHPTKLRLMGLVAALKALPAEMAHSGIDVTFTHENVPASLSQDLTLCLFRVAQEALQNAVKYSHARHVTLRLEGGPDALVLSAADDGTGFDVTGAWGKGLGLMSMRERVEAAGGALRIHSSPGAGTRLEVTVPLEVGRADSVAV